MADILSHDKNKEREVVDLALLSNFVHQVVNPLNGVAGTLDNLINGDIEEHRRKQRLGATRAQVEQCITLLRNLAFLSKGFGKLDKSERGMVTIPKVLIESAMFYQEEGARKSIRISLKDRNTQNKMPGHEELRRQVFMNIFDNCIKYGEKSREVEVNQWIQKNGGYAIVTIRSRALLPIDVEEIQKLTNLGYRGKNAKKVVASGTGLGLYICKHIIEDVHGGEFRIQAMRPNDLEFMIKIPEGVAGAV